MDGKPHKAIFQQALNHIQTLSIEKVIGCEPSKGWCRAGKCTVLIIGLIGLANGWIRRWDFMDSWRSHLEDSLQKIILKFLHLG